MAFHVYLPQLYLNLCLYNYMFLVYKKLVDAEHNNVILTALFAIN